MMQDFFRNPIQCYNKVQWKTFAVHAGSVLSTFSSFKLEEPRSSSNSTSVGSRSGPTDLDIPPEEQFHDSGHFFTKFLTNPKLLSLQLSESNFRRSVLVQLLFLFQYLNSTNKFKADNHLLTQVQIDWLRKTETTVRKLIHEYPSNGKKFAAVGAAGAENRKYETTWFMDDPLRSKIKHARNSRLQNIVLFLRPYFYAHQWILNV